MLTSLGRVFGVPKPLVGHVSLFRWQRGIGSLFLHELPRIKTRGFPFSSSFCLGYGGI
jgi:hypothetical protein